MNPSLEPGLYIVATPIGNLGDISPRAVDILQRAESVACEDSRITGRLLKHIGSNAPMVRYNDHSNADDRTRIVAMAGSGAVALVCDAGTPLISDPGYKLVRECIDADIKVHSIAGPAACIVALTLSGLPSDRFYFHGFLPNKSKARRDSLCALQPLPATLIFYESARRLAATLGDMAACFGTRPAAIVREISKTFEEAKRGDLTSLASYYADHAVKGEICIVVGGYDDPGPLMDDAAVDQALSEALKTMSTGKAASHTAKISGLDRKQLYERAVQIKSAK